MVDEARSPRPRTRVRKGKKKKVYNGHLQVGPSTVRQLNNPDYTDWETDELIRGNQRDKRGAWSGSPPKVIPLALLHELNRRMASHAIKDLNAAVGPAIEYLVSVAKGKDANGNTVDPDKTRVQVCQDLLNRVLGMSPQRIEIKELEPSVWEKEGVTKAIVVRDAIDVESEEWENPFED